MPKIVGGKLSPAPTAPAAPGSSAPSSPLRGAFVADAFCLFADCICRLSRGRRRLPRDPYRLKGPPFGSAQGTGRAVGERSRTARAARAGHPGDPLMEQLTWRCSQCPKVGASACLPGARRRRCGAALVGLVEAATQNGLNHCERLRSVGAGGGRCWRNVARWIGNLEMGPCDLEPASSAADNPENANGLETATPSLRLGGARWLRDGIAATGIVSGSSAPAPRP